MRPRATRRIGRRSLAAIGLLAALAAALATLGAGAGAEAPGPAAAAEAARNPCTGPGPSALLCPDLRVGPPTDLYAERHGGSGSGGEGDEHYAARRGRVRLHAETDIRSRGLGALELRGHRYRRNWMRVNQAIHRRGGGVRILRTRMRFHFYYVGERNGGHYWKARDPLSMEIWSLDRNGHPGHRLRKGPKVFYCFRDLERTRPGGRSPKSAVYPACSQDPSLRNTTLGTSVGWSDIYPSDYNRQWVDVTGLRGCFAYVLRVDPRNLVFESNESNNRSARRVRLPYRPGPQRCD